MKPIIFLAFIISHLSLWGFDATKEIERQFLATNITEFRISNTYGNLTFLPTSSDSIVVKTQIVADVIEITDTSEIFRYIETAMYKSKQTLRVKTSFDPDLNDAAHVSIHYTIYLPDTLNINIKNRYGDVFLFDIYGTKKIQLEYGKLLCDKILCPSFPPSSISLSFANFKGTQADPIDFKINNGSLQLDEISTSNLQSSFSIVQIKNGGKLECTSLNDKYVLDTIQDLTINGENTVASIQQLTKKLQVDFTSGSIKINQISPQFSGVDINVLNANAYLNTSSKSNYTINALIQYGSFIYPDNFSISALKDLDKTIYKGANNNVDSISSHVGIVGYNSTITLK